MASSKDSKISRSSAVLTSKSQKPSEQLVETTNPPSSPTPMSEQHHAVYTPVIKQNGVKDEEEDIFSPLRESMLYIQKNMYLIYTGVCFGLNFSLL